MVAPTIQIAQNVCKLLNIPKKQILAADPNNFYGFSNETCFIIYDEPHLYKRYDEVMRALNVGNYTLIFLPEFKLVGK